MIAEKAKAAIKEQLDVVSLVTDNIPNREQMGDFIKEGTEAAFGLASLATGGVPKEDLDEVGIFLGVATIGKVAENKKPFSDGSRLRVELIVIPPPVAPPVGTDEDSIG